MSRASLVVAIVAALGAVIAWRHLPSLSVAQDDGAPGTERPLATVRS